jgi:uncharacterized membrane protein
MTVPVIPGCIEQWYGYVPGVVKVNEKLCPVASGSLLNSALSALVSVFALTTVWLTPSWFVQVTVVPLGTVTVCGLNAKFWMTTGTEPGCPEGVVVCCVVITGIEVVAGVVDCWPEQPARRTARRRTIATKPRLRKGVSFILSGDNVSARYIIDPPQSRGTDNACGTDTSVSFRQSEGSRSRTIRLSEGEGEAV